MKSVRNANLDLRIKPLEEKEPGMLEKQKPWRRLWAGMWRGFFLAGAFVLLDRRCFASNHVCGCPMRRKRTAAGSLVVHPTKISIFLCGCFLYRQGGKNGQVPFHGNRALFENRPEENLVFPGCGRSMGFGRGDANFSLEICIFFSSEKFAFLLRDFCRFAASSPGFER